MSRSSRSISIYTEHGYDFQREKNEQEMGESRLCVSIAGAHLRSSFLGGLFQRLEQTETGGELVKYDFT